MQRGKTERMTSAQKISLVCYDVAKLINCVKKNIRELRRTQTTFDDAHNRIGFLLLSLSALISHLFLCVSCPMFCCMWQPFPHPCTVRAFEGESEREREGGKEYETVIEKN